MAFLIGTIPLVAIAWAIVRRFHRSFAEAFPVAVLSVIVALYLFGLAGILRIGVYAIYLIGLIIAVSGAVLLILQKKKTGRFCIQIAPGAAFALLFLIAIYFTCRGRMLLNWDEFSHWSTVVKNMYLLDKLGSCAASTAIYKSYPPAIALLQYYFMRLEPVFSEAALYRAKDVLTLALLLPFFKNIRWGEWKRLLLTAFLVIALPLVDYYYFYQSIHVDGLMGLAIAYMLISYYGAMRRDGFAWLSVSLGAFLLSMIKSSGFGMCILILGMIMADALMCRREDFPMAGKRARAYPLAAWLMPLCMLFFAKVSWEINLRVAGAADYWNMSEALSPARILDTVKNMQPYQKETLERFFAALFALRDDTYAVRLSPLLWIAVPLVPACAAWFLEPDRLKKKRIARVSGLLMAGYAAWLAALLFSFLFVFTDFEALNLDGFERYASTYQLACTVFVCWLLLETLEQNHRGKLTASLLLLVLAEMCFFSGSDLAKATLVAPQYNRYTRTQRERYPDAPDFSMLNPKTDRVLFIGQQSEATGLDFYYQRYLSTPVYVGMIGSWSIGKPYDADDDWTAELTLTEWQDAVYASDYTALYCFAVDDAFIKTFGAAFENPADVADGALFSISRGGGKPVFARIN